MSLTIGLILSCAVMAGVLFTGFMLLRPPKCPRCGSRERAPLPHFGKFMAYCKHCLKQVDMANWRKE